MKLYFENKKRVNEDVMVKLSTGDVIRMTDKQYDWADRIIDCLDLGDDEDAMTEVQKDFAEGKASKYLDKLEGKAPKRTLDAFKSFLGHESKKRMNEELWDSSRVLDLARYFLNKYPYADDDQIMKAIKKQMTKEGSTLPSNDSEFRRAYFSARDEYDEDDMYDESLSKERMNEDVSDSIMQSRLSLFKYLNRLDLGHSLSAVEYEPDLPLNAFGQAVYANEYEVVEELKTIQDQDARKIVLDVFHYLIKDWWTADGIYFYTNEEMYELLAKRYGWDE